MKPKIASLWIGKSLSYLEQLCLKSFIDCGHETFLYTYEDVKNVPEDVQVLDASTIMPIEKKMMDELGPAKIADRFRYKMLLSTDKIWVDTDAYCSKAFPDEPYFFAPDKRWKFTIANSVLRLPKDSATLTLIDLFASNLYPELPSDWPFQNKYSKEDYEKAGGIGKVHVKDLPYTIWGPQALGYFLNKSGEISHAIDRMSLYPVAGNNVKILLFPTSRSEVKILERGCYSVHLFGSSIRDILVKRRCFVNNEPIEKSWLDIKLKKHGIDPKKAPLVL